MTFDPYDPGFDERDWEAPVEGTVRVAVVGLGWFGSDMAIPAIQAADYCELGAVVSGSTEKAERIGEEHDATPLTYEAFGRGEGQRTYDAVYVVTPNALHLPYVETAAELGKPVICEKPLEASVERAEELVETASEGDIELMTAYRMQCHPPMRRVREAIREGFIGDVIQIDGAFSFNSIADESHDQWRFDPDLAGGGALYDVGVYPLNTARFLLDADPVAVQASVTRDEAVLGGLDRDATFLLEFPDDVVATCRTSYNCAGEDHLRIVGTDGRVEIEPAFEPHEERTLRISRSGVTTEVTTRHAEITEEFDYFANRLLAGEEIEPDGEDGLTDMRVMETVYESDDSGARVEP